jgi:hypothetical protein
MKRWLLVLILCIFGCSSKSGFDTALEAGMSEDAAKRLDEMLQRVDPGYRVVRAQQATNLSPFQSAPFKASLDTLYCVVISSSDGYISHMGVFGRNGEWIDGWMLPDGHSDSMAAWAMGGCGEW